MFYLISDTNSKKQIIDDSILKDNKAWSCNSLVLSIEEENNKLYFITAGGFKVFAGLILKKDEVKTNLASLGLKLNYNGNWYEIISLEDREELFIKVSVPYNEGYIISYRKIDSLDKNLVLDIKA